MPAVQLTNVDDGGGKKIREEGRRKTDTTVFSWKEKPIADGCRAGQASDQLDETTADDKENASDNVIRNADARSSHDRIHDQPNRCDHLSQCTFEYDVTHPSSL